VNKKRTANEVVQQLQMRNVLWAGAPANFTERPLFSPQNSQNAPVFGEDVINERPYHKKRAVPPCFLARFWCCILMSCFGADFWAEIECNLMTNSGDNPRREDTDGARLGARSLCDGRLPRAGGDRCRRARSGRARQYAHEPSAGCL